MDQGDETKLNALLEKSLRLIPPSVLTDLTSACTEKRDRAIRRAADIISHSIFASK